MPLKFDGKWRFHPPADGQFINQNITDSAIDDFIDLIIYKVIGENNKATYETFKSHFCQANSSPYYSSSDTSWAKSDMTSEAQGAAKNAPLFIEAYYDACESLRNSAATVFVPDIDILNEILARHNIGYEIKPPFLSIRETATPVISVIPPPSTIEEDAIDIISHSLSQSEQLLHQGQGRQAVQESLWLLETISTAFRGVDTGTGTIEGKYFNEIVKKLKTASPGTTLEQVLTWVTSLHGYLSSPTGGGIRHGLDLNTGVATNQNEARLFCNLIRSYQSFLLAEHERIVRSQTGS